MKYETICPECEECSTFDIPDDYYMKDEGVTFLKQECSKCNKLISFDYYTTHNIIARRIE